MDKDHARECSYPGENASRMASEKETREFCMDTHATALHLGFREENGQSYDRVFAVFIMIDSPATLYSTDYGMIQEVRDILWTCFEHCIWYR